MKNMKITKRITGIELLQMLGNGEIKDYTKIYLVNKNEVFDENKAMKFFTKTGVYIQLHLWREEEGKEAVYIRNIDTEDLLRNDFLIVEELTLATKIKKKLTEIIKDIEELESSIEE